MASTARDWRAILGRAFPIDDGTPLLSTDQVPDAAGYFTTHPVRSVTQGAKRAALTTSTPMQWPMSQQTPGLLTRRPPNGPLHHPFWHAQHAFHARQGEQPTGGQSSHGPATWPGTGAPYSGTRSASTPAPPPLLKAAAHQWERQHRSQPGHIHWEAVERILRYSPSTPDPHVAHVEVSSPQKGYPNATAASPWTGAPYRGARPPSSRAGTPQRRTAARRHRALAAPPQSPSETSRVSPHSFRAPRCHRNHARAVQPPPRTSGATTPTQAADAFAKALPSSTSPQPLAYV